MSDRARKTLEAEFAKECVGGRRKGRRVESLNMKTGGSEVSLWTTVDTWEIWIRGCRALIGSRQVVPEPDGATAVFYW